MNLSASVGFTVVGADEEFERALVRAEAALTDALASGNCVRSRWLM